MGIGVVAAAGFAILGIRELGAAAPSATSANERRQPEPAPAAATLLAVAARPIRTGETITAEMIRGQTINPALHPMAVLPMEALGKVATRDLPANAPIPRDALDQEAKLAIRVPVGMRAISIDTTAEIAVAGLLRPGDRVDVQVVYPGADAISGARGSGRSQAQTLLQMVQVLAVGDAVVGTQASGAAGDEPSPSSAPAPAVGRTVTLALFPDQVSMLSLAKSTGALHLSLRNPKDGDLPQVARAVSTGPLPASTLAVAPPLPPRPQPMPNARAPGPARQARPSPHAIDLVVGGSQHVIYSGSETR